MFLILICCSSGDIRVSIPEVNATVARRLFTYCQLWVQIQRLWWDSKTKRQISTLFWYKGPFPLPFQKNPPTLYCSISSRRREKPWKMMNWHKHQKIFLVFFTSPSVWCSPSPSERPQQICVWRLKQNPNLKNTWIRQSRPSFLGSTLLSASDWSPVVEKKRRIQCRRTKAEHVYWD